MDDFHFITKDDLPKLPKVLYKYRDWSDDYHKRILTHGEIYFASPNEFKEHSECTLERDYDCVTDKMIWELCSIQAMEQAAFGIIAPSDIYKLANQLYSNHSFHDIENRRKTESEFKTLLNNAFSIFCASEIATNERLWEDFSNHRTGFCVGIDFTEIYKNPNVFGHCQRVQYYDINNPPKVPAITLNDTEGVNKMLQIIYSLPNRFAEEKEFRFNKTNMKNRMVKLNSNWIKEIILGDKISSSDEQEILKIANDKYPDARLKRLFYEPTFDYFSAVNLKN